MYPSLMQPVTIGIDVGSRKISWSRFVGDRLMTAGHLEVPASSRAREIGLLLQAIEAPLIGADVVLVEEPLVGRAVRASLLVAQTAGAALSQADRYCPDAHISLVDNKTWKKSIVGNGNADKDKIATWLETNHEDYYRDWCIYQRPKAGATVQQDRVDAICIGLYGVEIAARSAAFAQGEAI